MNNPIDSFVICNSNIEQGWRFSTADFSCIANGRNKAGDRDWETQFLRL